MTGGAFKNSSNLLGRRREIEELKKSVSELSKSSTELKTKIADNRAKIASIRELIDADNKANREASLAVNTEQMNLNQAKQKLSEIKIIYDKDKAETTEIDRQIKEIDENKNQVSGSLSALEIQNESSRKEIEVEPSQLSLHSRMRCSPGWLLPSSKASSISAASLPSWSTGSMIVETVGVVRLVQSSQLSPKRPICCGSRWAMGWRAL